MNNLLQQSVGLDVKLGQKSPYPTSYDPSLLFPISRKSQREAMGFSPLQKFLGFDEWNCLELAWLNFRGKPIRATARLFIPADSPFLPESKSVKLYLHSLNSRNFSDSSEVINTVISDISQLCQAPIEGHINAHTVGFLENIHEQYFCLDNLDINIQEYNYNAHLLACDPALIKQEKVYTHAFKSHCLCTGQPDWGSVFIEYEGPYIARENLLAYLISFHKHQGFSENCIEQIFVDIMTRVKPEKLTIFGRFTRRGGIEINPYRATHSIEKPRWRLSMQ